MISSPETEVSIPSPPETVSVSPKSTALFEPLSAETVIVEFDNELLPIFDNVLLLPLIVLLVSVSVVSFKTIVPVAFGIVTVLSASGLAATRVVSFSSSDEPSKTNLSTTFIVELSTVVVVPCTVKSPVTIRPSAIEIVVESELDKVVPLICISDDCKALVPLPKRIEFAVCVTAPVPPAATPIKSPDSYSAKPLTSLPEKVALMGVFTAIISSLLN